MRLTVALYKQPIRFFLKKQWVKKGKFYRYPTSPPAPVIAKGVEVFEATKLYGPKKMEPLEEFTRPDHPLFDPKLQPEDHPDYHEQPIYDYRRSSRLTQGENAVCNLTKTQHFYGLPDSVTQLIGQVEIPDQDTLVQRYIMQANIWHPSNNRLPKRYNNRIPGYKFKREFGIRYEKRAHILIRNLVRLIQTLGGEYPDLLMDRIVHHSPYIQAHFKYQDKPIQIHDTMDYLVKSHRPLPAFADEDVVDATTQHTLPDLYPILPTIDLEKNHKYKDNDHNGFNGTTAPRHPHTIVLHNKFWPTREQNAKMLMFLFGNAILAARQRFGAGVKILPEPVCVQAVGIDGVKFHFGCFQLNTLDLTSDNGIKNLVWFDNDKEMYKRLEPKRAMLRNTEYRDYDPAVLRKLIALYINGADLSVRGWDHLNESETGGETVETRGVLSQ